ncbi:hypothetical protein [Rhodococcus sp. 1168]|uniref:Rv1733c family protein n=1 Tax=Rhodococcus sp. 1168 TaxID=2018041 RepID=UPI000A09D7E1|nr:hypothetical protein [Rhodococcus sp. 1168]ORI19346.1 hypothetical protein BJI47_12240 [Rhodococcus sp. 1168]
MRRKHAEHAGTPRSSHLVERNPLVRRSDRIQSTIKTTVFALIILMLPVAAWIGTSTLAVGQSRVAAQESSVRQVTATTKAVADIAPVLQSEVGSVTSTTVDATWSYDGLDHQGQVSLPAGSPSGTQLPIWVDRDGNPTAPPATRADAVVTALFTGFGSLFAAASILLGTYFAVRVRLDAQRHADWDREIAELLDQDSPS